MRGAVRTIENHTESLKDRKHRVPFEGIVATYYKELKCH